MKQKEKHQLKPKLRFPEFRTSPEWTEYRLAEISTRIIEKVGNLSLMPVSITAGQGFVSQAEKFGRDISGKQYKNYVVLNEGEFAYNKGYSKKFPQGCIYKLKEFQQVAAPNAYICFRLKRDHIADFYQGYFELNYHGLQLHKFITSGVRGDGLLNVSPDDFFNVRFLSPNTHEQQKIADCLASLDELIAAHSQKLNALQAHKKGLMQQLFPAGGETLPQLRFPEFQDAPEWEEKPLGIIAENLDNMRVPVTASNRVPGKVPYYGASGIIDYINDFIFDEDLLCISEDGANLVARTYPIAFSISGKSWVNNHAHVLRFENKSTQKIIESYLNSIKIDDFLTGMAQPKLNRAMLDSIPVPLPDIDEQQKIADCLSSLDEQITAQSQKLDALNAHKKGLLQQLFPSPDEVQG